MTVPLGVNDARLSEACALIHEKLDGAPFDDRHSLPEIFLMLERQAEAWRRFTDAYLSDWEGVVVLEIEERAGIVWRCKNVRPGPSCPPEECGKLNFFTEPRCLECEAERPESPERGVAGSRDVTDG